MYMCLCNHTKECLIVKINNIGNVILVVYRSSLRFLANVTILMHKLLTAKR